MGNGEEPETDNCIQCAGPPLLHVPAAYKQMKSHHILAMEVSNTLADQHSRKNNFSTPTRERIHQASKQMSSTPPRFNMCYITK